MNGEQVNRAIRDAMIGETEVAISFEFAWYHRHQLRRELGDRQGDEIVSAYNANRIRSIVALPDGSIRIIYSSRRNSTEGGPTTSFRRDVLFDSDLLPNTRRVMDDV